MSIIKKHTSHLKSTLAASQYPTQWFQPSLAQHQLHALLPSIQHSGLGQVQLNTSYMPCFLVSNTVVSAKSSSILATCLASQYPTQWLRPSLAQHQLHALLPSIQHSGFGQVQLNTSYMPCFLVSNTVAQAKSSSTLATCLASQYPTQWFRPSLAQYQLHALLPSIQHSGLGQVQLNTSYKPCFLVSNTVVSAKSSSILATCLASQYPTQWLRPSLAQHQLHALLLSIQHSGFGQVQLNTSYMPCFLVSNTVVSAKSSSTLATCLASKYPTQWFRPSLAQHQQHALLPSIQQSGFGQVQLNTSNMPCFLVSNTVVSAKSSSTLATCFTSKYPTQWFRPSLAQHQQHALLPSIQHSGFGQVQLNTSYMPCFLVSNTVVSAKSTSTLTTCFTSQYPTQWFRPSLAQHQQHALLPSIQHSGFGQVQLNTSNMPCFLVSNTVVSAKSSSTLATCLASQYPTQQFRPSLPQHQLHALLPSIQHSGFGQVQLNTSYMPCFLVSNTVVSAKSSSTLAICLASQYPTQWFRPSLAQHQLHALLPSIQHSGFGQVYLNTSYMLYFLVSNTVVSATSSSTLATCLASQYPTQWFRPSLAQHQLHALLPSIQHSGFGQVQLNTSYRPCFLVSNTAVSAKSSSTLATCLASQYPTQWFRPSLAQHQLHALLPSIQHSGFGQVQLNTSYMPCFLVSNTVVSAKSSSTLATCLASQYPTQWFQPSLAQHQLHALLLSIQHSGFGQVQLNTSYMPCFLVSNTVVSAKFSSTLATCLASQYPTQWFRPSLAQYQLHALLPSIQHSGFGQVQLNTSYMPCFLVSNTVVSAKSSSTLATCLASQYPTQWFRPRLAQHQLHALLPSIQHSGFGQVQLNTSYMPCFLVSNTVVSAKSSSTLATCLASQYPTQWFRPSLAQHQLHALLPSIQHSGFGQVQLNTSYMPYFLVFNTVVSAKSSSTLATCLASQYPTQWFRPSLAQHQLHALLPSIQHSGFGQVQLNTSYMPCFLVSNTVVSAKSSSTLATCLASQYPTQWFRPSLAQHYLHALLPGIQHSGFGQVQLNTSYMPCFLVSNTVVSAKSSSTLATCLASQYPTPWFRPSLAQHQQHALLPSIQHSGFGQVQLNTSYMPCFLVSNTVVSAKSTPTLATCFTSKYPTQWFRPSLAQHQLHALLPSIQHSGFGQVQLNTSYMPCFLVSNTVVSAKSSSTLATCLASQYPTQWFRPSLPQHQLHALLPSIQHSGFSHVQLNTSYMPCFLVSNTVVSAKSSSTLATCLASQYPTQWFRPSLAQHQLQALLPSIQHSGFGQVQLNTSYMPCFLVSNTVVSAKSSSTLATCLASQYPTQWFRPSLAQHQLHALLPSIQYSGFGQVQLNTSFMPCFLVSNTVVSAKSSSTLATCLASQYPTQWFRPSLAQHQLHALLPSIQHSGFGQVQLNTSYMPCFLVSNTVVSAKSSSTLATCLASQYPTQWFRPSLAQHQLHALLPSIQHSSFGLVQLNTSYMPYFLVYNTVVSATSSSTLAICLTSQYPTQ